MLSEFPVGREGEIRLPEELRRRWGLSPGAELWVRETPEGLLLRRADPPLGRVYVEPTNGCNLSCRTCVRNSWREPVGSMSMEIYRRLVDGLRSVPSLRAVSFWGFGEPLLHPHIVEMVALAKELGARTQLITNGLLLSQKLSEGLVAAGLDSLVVSIDGASPEIHAEVRSGADLRVVQRNLETLNAVRRTTPEENPEVGLEFVAMRRNVSELPQLRRLAFQMGASFIVVTNVLPYTEELKDEVLYGAMAGTSYPSLRSSGNPEIFLPRMDLRREVVESAGGLLRYTSASGIPAGRWEAAGGYCRFVGEGAMVVGWDGEVSPCIALMHSYPCYVMGRQKVIRRYTLGNVGREEAAHLWEKGEYVSFRDRVQSFEFSPCSDCGGCDLSDSNEEDCAGNHFPVCGDCLWAKGVIQCP